MIIYEDERTHQIVRRLVALAKNLPQILVFVSALLFAALFAAAFALVSPGLWWLGALLGLFAGAGVGFFIAAVLIACLEWMAQVLVAQGEIISRLGK